MDQLLRGVLQRVVQSIRDLIERDYRKQLEGEYDVFTDHLSDDVNICKWPLSKQLARRKIVAAILHHDEASSRLSASISQFVRESAFTTLNRFVALKILESRKLIQECISRFDQSTGFREFVGLAPGLGSLEDGGYRLYLECILDELSTEVRVLFDRRDSNSLLWPKRSTLIQVIERLTSKDLDQCWFEDETIGWVYQYFNSEEERREMRAGSRAPSSSREVAVRNQFFTPKYVVKFLTENTLGRLWLEMQGSSSNLKDAWSYFLDGNTNPIQGHVSAKDPRDIKVLDPACGSGHFLLYAFELFTSIYQDAWRSNTTPPSKITGNRLRADFPDFDSFARHIPSLIIEHNLFGLEIDSRAAQITAFALWLKAINSNPSCRGLLPKTNIGVAESFAELPSDALSFEPEQIELLGVVKELLSYASEAGSLLNIDSTISEAIRKIYGDNGELFREVDRQRWLDAEIAINKIIEHLASANDSGNRFQGRMIAEDASNGMVFIDLLRQKYDVVLMNPPFGQLTDRACKVVDDLMSRSGRDLGASFVRAAVENWTQDGALIGVIISAASWFKPSYSAWREDIFLGRLSSLVLAAHLGGEVLDGASVSASPFVLRRCCVSQASILRLRNAPHGLDEGMLNLINSCNKGVPDENVYRGSPRDMAFLQGSPLSYWVSERLRQRIVKLPVFQSESRTVKQGMINADEPRFTRLWWEVERSDSDWLPYVKGSEYSPLWDNAPFTVKSKDDFLEIRATGRARLQGLEYFGRSGVTIPIRSVLGFNPRLLPVNAAFSNLGSSAFTPDMSSFALLSVMVSRPVEYLVSLFLGDLQGKKGVHPNHYDVGAIQRIPWPNFSSEAVQELDAIGRRLVANGRALNSTNEIARNFAGVQIDCKADLDQNVQILKEREADLIKAILCDRALADRLVTESYGFEECDIVKMQETFSDMTPPASGLWCQYFGVPGTDIDSKTVAESILSWIFGVAFGRWLPSVSVCPSEVAIPDARELPPLLNTFANDQRKYFVSDEGHRFDIANALSDASESCGLIGELSVHSLVGELEGEDPEDADIRKWISNKFFDLHIKRYSSQRRKAPLYLQLSTKSNLYSIWCSFTNPNVEMLYDIVDLVQEKLATESSRLERLRGHSGDGNAATVRKDIDFRERIIDELKSLIDECKRLIKIWSPHLDDGVLVNAAPFWRLFNSSREWQKECKANWDALADGQYDWSHMAMNLWPERVIAKCIEDPSLAVAHGLDTVFWIQDDRARFQQKSPPNGSWKSTIDKLVAQRTRPGVRETIDSISASKPEPKSRRRKQGGKT